jgi:hypothetical protein
VVGYLDETAAIEFAELSVTRADTFAQGRLASLWRRADWRVSKAKRF